ncbi:MAG: molybdate ABC transporter substrate-binding protein [Spirochaetes bacterium]|nr:molybdate ABC transporter substrate-binding protein [Spirochaetota bacterium]
MRIGIIIFIFLLFISCGEKPSLLIMCGSASQLPMTKIAGLYSQRKNIKVDLIYGGSGTLLSQISLTRKGDIYLPGSPDYIVKGVKQKIILKGSVRKVAYLIPGIIVPKGNPGHIRNIFDLTNKDKKIGTGNPETVALGLYAVEFLERNDLLKVIPNITVFAASCSQTLNLVLMKKVDAVLAWRVCARWNKDRLQYIPLPPHRIPRISYIPVCIPVYARDESLSRDFIEFLLSETGKNIYREYGYIISLSEAREYAPRAKIGGECQLPAQYYQLLKNEK